MACIVTRLSPHLETYTLDVDMQTRWNIETISWGKFNNDAESVLKMVRMLINCQVYRINLSIKTDMSAGPWGQGWVDSWDWVITDGHEDLNYFSSCYYWHF